MRNNKIEKNYIQKSFDANYNYNKEMEQAKELKYYQEKDLLNISNKTNTAIKKVYSLLMYKSPVWKTTPTQKHTRNKTLSEILEKNATEAMKPFPYSPIKSPIMEGSKTDRECSLEASFQSSKNNKEGGIKRSASTTKNEIISKNHFSMYAIPPISLRGCKTQDKNARQFQNILQKKDRTQIVNEYKDANDQTDKLPQLTKTNIVSYSNNATSSLKSAESATKLSSTSSLKKFEVTPKQEHFEYNPFVGPGAYEVVSSLGKTKQCGTHPNSPSFTISGKSQIGRVNSKEKRPAPTDYSPEKMKVLKSSPRYTNNKEKKFFMNDSVSYYKRNLPVSYPQLDSYKNQGKGGKVGGEARFRNRYQKLPGPAEYSSEKYHSIEYQSSKVLKSLNTTFGAYGHFEEDRHMKPSPGPGYYDGKESLRSTRTVFIPASMRFNHQNESSPGPNSYNLVNVEKYKKTTSACPKIGCCPKGYSVSKLNVICSLYKRKIDQN